MIIFIYGHDASPRDETMDEPGSVKGSMPEGIRLREIFSPWMLGVLGLFAVCEALLLVWGHEAAYVAVIGLLMAMMFGLMRYCRVHGNRGCLMSIVVVGGLMVITFVLPMHGHHEAARRMQCMSQLKQLGRALYNYESEWGRFPPAFVADKTGRPMHSWRALLIPHIEETGLRDYYDFQKPWDSPGNQKLATKSSVKYLQCPSVLNSPDRSPYRTDYVAVVGDNTFWSADGTPHKARDIRAGTSNTAVLIEINDSDIAWHEPRDVKLDDFLSGKLSWSKTGVHGGECAFYEPQLGRNVLFGDGSVRFFWGEPTPDQLRRLFSITEPFDPQNEEFPEIAARPIVFRHVVFWVWLAMLAMQFVYIFFPVGRRPMSFVAGEGS